MKREMKVLVLVATLLAAAAAPTEALAQVGERDVSGIRVMVAPVVTTMSGRFRGTAPHMYQNFNGLDLGPGGGAMLLADFRNFGLNLEVNGSGHRMGAKNAVAIYVRFGARYHPPFTIAGFAPWLDASLFAMPILAEMDNSEIPAEIGTGIVTECCAYGDDPTLASDEITGHSFAVWFEREMGRGFSFWTRIGSDIGRVTGIRRGDASYTHNIGSDKRRWVAQRVSLGFQYAFWPLR